MTLTALRIVHGGLKPNTTSGLGENVQTSQDNDLAFSSATAPLSGTSCLNIAQSAVEDNEAVDQAMASHKFRRA